jgi:hypothetical protein
MLRLTVLFATAATVLALASSAAATPPSPFTITTNVTFSETAPPSGTVSSATGLSCTSGTFVDQFVGRGQGGAVRKVFTCAEGTFTILFHPRPVAFDPNTGTALASGPCNFLSGTGAFEGVYGTCSFSVVINVNTASGIETFSGEVHFDP